MKLSNGVFERNGYKDTLSERAFYTVLGLAIAWGLGGTAIVAHQVAQWGYQPDIWSIIILGLAIPILGIILGIKSDKPFYSFIGYNMISIPFGVILAPIVNRYNPQLIQNIFMTTCCVTIIMMFLSWLYPGIFSRLGGVLFSALLGLLVVRVLQLFIPGMNLSLFDWIGAAIFSFYIGYDWWRASQISKTVDNAIDIAISLYLDIINLFLIVVSLTGKNRN